MANNKILITGGSGFIGANLTREFLKLGFEPNLLIRHSTDMWRLKDILKNVRFHKVSLLDKNRLREVAHRVNPAAIFHLATFTDYRHQDKIQEMIDTNITATANLLLATCDVPYDVFVNTGSSSEYGFKEKSMKEKDLLEPISFYAATKGGATLLAQAFAHYYEKPVTTFRPFSVYGPLEEAKRFIPVVTESILSGSPINLTTGSQRRDFIFVDDVVEAYIMSMKHGSKLKGEILNIGTGKQYTNDEVVEILFKVTGRKVPIHKGAYPVRLWDSPYWVADVTKAKKLLGWSPKHSLESGLLATYNWAKQKNGQI